MERYSAYVPFHQNAGTVRAAVESVLAQVPAPSEVVAIDDGSQDDSAKHLAGLRVRVITHTANLGRGAARARAMAETREKLVLCCDATNVLPAGFAARALGWLADPGVAAAFGRIRDPAPQGVVGRWRARHLFRQERADTVRHHALLATYGAMVRRESVAAAGGFDPRLRHNEDGELGRRLLSRGFQVVFDPELAAHCNVTNTAGEVLERYWRWNAGAGTPVSLGSYLRTGWYALRVMAAADLRAGDPLAVALSLASPHYALARSLCSRHPDQPRPSSA